MAILNLSHMPADPAERLLWLSGVKQAAQTELDAQFAETYAALRYQGRIEWAINQRLHGKKRILALTRQWNRQQGRMVRWNDGLDPSSTAYRG
jgi:hypothetical protein